MAPDGPIYSSLRNRPALASVVREFAMALPDMAEELRRFATSGDLERVRKLAHRMKGSTGGYGFDEIMRAAGALETSAAAGDAAAVTAAVPAIRALCDRARAGAGAGAGGDVHA